MRSFNPFTRSALLICLCWGLLLVARAEPIQSVSIGENREFIVNGKAFFPLMGWLQDPRNFPVLKECGMNCTAGYWKHSGGTKDVVDYMQKVKEAGLYGVMPFDSRLKGNLALLGYIQEDEPDLAKRTVLKTDAFKRVRQTPPQTVAEYRKIKGVDSSRPVFLTLTGDFLPFFGKFTDEDRAALYPAYVKSCDVIGYDIYPIYGWNKPEWIYLVHDATERLVQPAGKRPVYAWIETSKGGQYTGTLENQIDVTPADIRAETWMAICRGATAIGYFTHVWKPSYKQFGVPAENLAALRQMNARITRLAPEILGRPVVRGISAQSSAGVKVDVMAKETTGTLTLFAVNYDPSRRETDVEIHASGIGKGATAEVVDEARSIVCGNGVLSDHFAPLAVHVYRLRLSHSR